MSGKIGNVFTQRRGEINLVVLLVDQDLANLLGHGELAECFALAHPIAVVTDRVDGEILESPRGTGGFGYDPIFYFPALKKTFAELTAEEKNQFSHRGKAFRRLLSALSSMTLS